MRTKLRTVALRTSFGPTLAVGSTPRNSGFCAHRLKNAGFRGNLLGNHILETLLFLFTGLFTSALFTRLRLLQPLLHGLLLQLEKYGFAVTLPATIASVTILKMRVSVVTPLVTCTLVTTCKCPILWIPPWIPTLGYLEKSCISAI